MASSRHPIDSDGFRGSLEVHAAGPGGADPRLFGITAPHARLADGRTVVLSEAAVDRGPTALDAETVDTAVPVHVAAILGAGGGVTALGAWTRLEVAAKLTDTPVLLLLRGAAAPPHVDVMTTQIDDIVVSVGRGAVDAAISH